MPCKKRSSPAAVTEAELGISDAELAELGISEGDRDLLGLGAILEERGRGAQNRIWWQPPFGVLSAKHQHKSSVTVHGGGDDDGGVWANLPNLQSLLRGGSSVLRTCVGVWLQACIL